jgi:hypothetical protein
LLQMLSKKSISHKKREDEFNSEHPTIWSQKTETGK